MPRRVDHVDGVVVAVGIQVLRPRDGGGAGIGILRQETGGGRVVVAGVHVEQAGGIRNAPRERHLVEERIPRAGRHAELVVVVGLDDRALALINSGSKLPHALYAPERIGSKPTGASACLLFLYSNPPILSRISESPFVRANSSILPGFLSYS